MLISETTCDFELFADVEHAAEVGEQLAVYSGPRGSKRPGARSATTRNAP